MRRKCSWSIVAACGIALAAFLLTGPARLWGQKAGEEAVAIAASDSFVYRLVLNGEPMDVYSECSGLGSSSDIEEQKVVTDKGIVAWQMSPGALRWDKITLKRDSPSGQMVQQWRRNVEEGRLTEAIKSGTIIMLGSNSSQEYARWSFRNGWPARLSFNEGVEELVIVHDGLESLAPGPGSAGTTKKR
jgi:phage tail-like protein